MSRLNGGQCYFRMLDVFVQFFFFLAHESYELCGNNVTSENAQSCPPTCVGVLGCMMEVRFVVGRFTNAA